MSFKIGHQLLETVLSHTSVVAGHGQSLGISCADTLLNFSANLQSAHLLMIKQPFWIILG